MGANRADRCGSILGVAQNVSGNIDASAAGGRSSRGAADLTYSALAASSQPFTRVARDTWRTWGDELRTNGGAEKTVAEVALELGLPWPLSRRADIVGEYLDDQPAHLLLRKGIGAKKARTLVLVVAHLALVRRNRRQAPQADGPGGSDGIHERLFGELARLIAMQPGTVPDGELREVLGRYHVDAGPNVTIPSGTTAAQVLGTQLLALWQMPPKDLRSRIQSVIGGFRLAPVSPSLAAGGSVDVGFSAAADLTTARDRLLGELLRLARGAPSALPEEQTRELLAGYRVQAKPGVVIAVGTARDALEARALALLQARPENLDEQLATVVDDFKMQLKAGASPTPLGRPTATEPIARPAVPSLREAGGTEGGQADISVSGEGEAIAQEGVKFGGGSTDELVRRALTLLKEREAMILTRRAGLDGQPPETLAELGTRLNVTRERVRQIESKALTKLRLLSDFRGALEEAVARESSAIWDRVATGEGVVRMDLSESDLLQRLRPEQELALWILNIRVGDLIEGIGEAVGGGWVRATVDRHRVDRVLHYIDYEAPCFPIEAEHVAKRMGAPLSIVRTAIAVSTRVRAHGGYLARGRFSARLRRAVWLHRLLASEANAECVSARELVRRHNAVRPTEPCTVRDAEIVLFSRPHLFLQMGRDAWRALGGRPLSGEAPTGTDEDEDEVEDGQEPVGNQDETIVGHLRQIFLEDGPMRLREVDAAFEMRTQEKFSLSGMHALLVTAGHFVRLAPGVYGLPEQLEDRGILAVARRSLLTEEACARYVRARFAGEARGVFPLWDQEMEEAWLAWLRKEDVASTLRRSLEIVASTSESELPSSVGYELDAGPVPAIGPNLPPMEELAAPLAAAARRRWLGWVGVNRLCGNRQDDRTTLDVLAVLVGLGALESEHDWRRGHRTTSSAQHLYQAMEDELHGTGSLSWSSNLGTEWKALLRDAGRHEHGWIPAGALNSLSPDLRLLASDESTAAQVLRPVVELAVLVAQADGHVHPDEEATLRNYVKERLPGTSARIQEEVKVVLNRIRDAEVSVAVADVLRELMSKAQREELLAFLLQIARADGVFCKEEEDVLREVQQRLGVDDVYYAAQLRRRSLDEGVAPGASTATDVDELLDMILS